MRRLGLLCVVALLAACSSQPTSTPSLAVSQVPSHGTAAAPTTLATVAPAATDTTSSADSNTPTAPVTLSPEPTATPTTAPLDPLTIQYLRQRDYTGSGITIEQALAPHSTYNQYIASYQSDGLKIYALLTVPKGNKPATGWPVIIFNHGFIPPQIYRTTERYVAYVDAIASSGYIVFKPDYRGHGNSEGQATGGYGSPDYTVDVLNALASLKKYPGADPNRIGMWGHSMGGQVTLRAAVVSRDIKAEVIWSGVVGSYPNLIEHWRRPGARPFPTPRGTPDLERNWRARLTQQYGTPEANPAFWASISPNSYVSELSGPLQLHHDLNDTEVPFQFSQELYDEVTQAGRIAGLYSYPGDDHNIANSFSLAMQRSVAFFDKYVKQLSSQ